MSGSQKSIIRVGLTGGIASGKSTVSALLAEHGAVIVDYDPVSYTHLTLPTNSRV